MKKLTWGIILLLLLSLGSTFLVKWLIPPPPPERVEVVQWTNGHMMRPGLQPDMATKFNEANYKTKSGKRIVVSVYNHGSAEISDDLISRINRGIRTDQKAPDPTVVTPSSADWLVRANYATGKTVVDLTSSKTIASTYVGIVTYQDMAEALGWPDKQIGYADIIALRKNPEGWASVPHAKAEWGQKPLFAFTDPITSTTGRDVLFGLYGIGFGKAPGDLTSADVSDPKVVAYVKDFQTLIDHYMIGTIPLMTKVYQGKGYGHFFMMPEDNLISLYQGGEKVFVDGIPTQMNAITEPMVMIYPKEGSMVRNNIAGIVNASWVTPEQVEGANKWIDFMLQDEQQHSFLEDGFRPGTNLSLADPVSKITGKYGLQADPKVPLLMPETINPVVADVIEKSWQDVKKPGIVTFVVDVSGSMDGEKLDQVKTGLVRAVDTMAQNNQVGLITFSSTVIDVIPVKPLAQNRYSIANTAKGLRAQAGTSLYDGIKAGIDLTDKAVGEENAIRGVVVLTDGKANEGATRLDNLVTMISRNEVPIKEFRGWENDVATDINLRPVSPKDIIGRGPAIKTEHPIQVFFIGVGDADLQIGRILSQATGAEFQGATEKDLANLLEQFSKYF